MSSDVSPPSDPIPGEPIPGVQKIRGEFTTLTGDAQARHRRLRQIAEEMLSQYGTKTIALDEVVGLNNLRLRRSPLQPYCAWAAFGE